MSTLMKASNPFLIRAALGLIKYMSVQPLPSQPRRDFGRIVTGALQKRARTRPRPEAEQDRVTLGAFKTIERGLQIPKTLRREPSQERAQLVATDTFHHSVGFRR